MAQGKLQRLPATPSSLLTSSSGRGYRCVRILEIGELFGRSGPEARLYIVMSDPGVYEGLVTGDPTRGCDWEP